MLLWWWLIHSFPFVSHHTLCGICMDLCMVKLNAKRPADLMLIAFNFKPFDLRMLMCEDHIFPTVLWICGSTCSHISQKERRKWRLARILLKFFIIDLNISEKRSAWHNVIFNWRAVNSKNKRLKTALTIETYIAQQTPIDSSRDSRRQITLTNLWQKSGDYVEDGPRKDNRQIPIYQNFNMTPRLGTTMMVYKPSNILAHVRFV